MVRALILFELEHSFRIIRTSYFVSNRGLQSRYKAFIDSSLRYQFLFEIIVAVWQPIPGFSHIYGLGRLKNS